MNSKGTDRLVFFQVKNANMPARVEDEWSDSDEECDSSGVETSVQLGLPDGPITAQEDLKDPRVSRIGGHPVRFVHPSSDASYCSLLFVSTLGFSCILPTRCIRIAMQKLFEPHATRFPDLVSNRR